MGAPNIRYCRPDPSEKFWPNGNYGNSLALKRYAGYPTNEPVWAVIPHGIFYEDDYVFPGEAMAPLPAVLNWPMHRDGVWAQYKEVIPSAAPFLYALETYPHAKERKGTVIMPQHSTTLLDFHWDPWAFLEEVKTFPRPWTVLLYYNDVQQDMHRFFPGMTCKCCGHVNDTAYLERLVGYLTGAEWVVSNEVGSYTQYATAAGAKFRLTEAGKPDFYLNQMGIDEGYTGVFHGSEDRHPEEKRRVAEIDALFRGQPMDVPITKEQQDCCDYYLRRTAFKSPEGLLADLNHCKANRRRKHEGARVVA